MAEEACCCIWRPLSCHIAGTEKKHRSKRGAPLARPSPNFWPPSSLVRLLLKSCYCLPRRGATAASCCQGQAVRTCPGNFEVCRHAASEPCCGCLEGATLEPCLLCYVPIFGENPLGGATKSRRNLPSVLLLPKEGRHSVSPRKGEETAKEMLACHRELNRGEELPLPS